MPIDPKDAKEQMAIFRSKIVGHLSARDLLRGELKEELENLAQHEYRPPNADRSRTFGFSTLERWHYALAKHGLEGVEPKPRSDRGYAQNLTEEERKLLVDIAEQQPEVSIPILLREVIATGRLRANVISEATIRRLFDAFGLNRQQRRTLLGKLGRRRWQRASPHEL